MRRLRSFLECDGCNTATPANTTGMGNPTFPSGDKPGSEPCTGPDKNEVKKFKKSKKNKEE